KAINPTSGKEIPVWVSDFAIATFGTGALFGDAHDDRDVEFARKFGIPLKETIEPVTTKRTGLDALRGAEEPIKRPGVIAVVKHWSEEKYLAVTFKPTNLHGFVSGGVEQGEDPVETGKREIRE